MLTEATPSRATLGYLDSIGRRWRPRFSLRRLRLTQVTCALCYFRLLTVLYFRQPKKAHFDATHDLEELLLEDNPLRARERNPKQDINKLTVEYRQMEEK